MRKLETLEDMIAYAKVGDIFVLGGKSKKYKTEHKTTIVKMKDNYNTITEDNIYGDADGNNIPTPKNKSLNSLINAYYYEWKDDGIYILSIEEKTSYELGLEIAIFFNALGNKTLIESIARTLGKLIQEHKYDGLIASLSAHMLSEQTTSVIKMRCADFIEQIIKF